MSSCRKLPLGCLNVKQGRCTLFRPLNLSNNALWKVMYKMASNQLIHSNASVYTSFPIYLSVIVSPSVSLALPQARGSLLRTNPMGWILISFWEYRIMKSFIKGRVLHLQTNQPWVSDFCLLVKNKTKWLCLCGCWSSTKSLCHAMTLFVSASSLNSPLAAVPYIVSRREGSKCVIQDPEQHL